MELNAKRTTIVIISGIAVTPNVSANYNPELPKRNASISNSFS